MEKLPALPLKVAAAKFIRGYEDQTHHGELGVFLQRRDQSLAFNLFMRLFCWRWASSHYQRAVLPEWLLIPACGVTPSLCRYRLFSQSHPTSRGRNITRLVFLGQPINSDLWRFHIMHTFNILISLYSSFICFLLHQRGTAQLPISRSSANSMFSR